MVIYASSVGQLLHQATQLLQQGQLEPAWNVIHQVLGADPRNPTAFQLRGLILAQIGQIEEAADDFRIAVDLTPG